MKNENLVSKKLEKLKRYNKDKTSKISNTIYQKEKNKPRNNIYYPYYLFENSFIFLIVIILFLNRIFCPKKGKNHLNYLSSITIKIKGTGEQNIIFGGWGNVCYRLSRTPDRIIINDIEQENVDYKYNFDSSQTINIVKIIWNNDLTTCHCLFFECSSIVEVDLSNFNSSKVTSMNSMFDSCTSLTSVNFSNFVTTRVSNMEYMFYGCAFTSLDLSTFETSRVYTMSYMFSDCVHLTSLNLSSFYTPLISDMSSMFNGCSNLGYINLQNAVISTSVNIQDILIGTAKNLVICLNQNSLNNINLNSSLISQGCAISDCSNYWVQIINKIYEEQNINECTLLNYIKNTIKICPNGTYLNDSQECEKCEEKCSLCNLDSINNNLCLACNEGYYQIYNNSNKSKAQFIECVKSPVGYYLDKNDLFYKECYLTCKKCEFNGSEISHNCTVCKDEYNYQTENFNSLNCYKNCSKYYYLNKVTNQYFCTETLNCPDLYNKLIVDKNECIDECINDDKYQYLYLNNCYDKCPEGSKNQENNQFICEKIQINEAININESTQINNEVNNETANIITNYNTYNNIYENDLYEKTDIKYEKTNTNEILDKFNFMNITTDITNEKTNENEIANNINSTIVETYDIYLKENETTDNIIKDNSDNLNHINMKENDKDNVDNNEILLNIDFSKIFNNTNINITNQNFINLYSEDKKKLIQYLKKIILGEIDIYKIKNGIYNKIQWKEILITLRLLESEKIFRNNETSIDFKKCENIIKNEYNIPNNNDLYILKNEVSIQGMNIRKIEYELYYPLYGKELIKLNLTKCQNEKIYLYYNIAINKSIDEYNPKSKYYNDICSKTTSDYGTDICLKDRRINFIKNNMTLCEENCEFVDYDYINKRAMCSCKVKLDLSFFQNLNFNEEEFFKNFAKINNLANFGLLKCYKYLFKKDNFLHNYGSIIFMFLMFLYFITLILFYCKYYDLLKKKINNIISKKKKTEFFIEYNNNKVTEENINKRNKNIERKKKIRRTKNKNIKNKKKGNITQNKNNPPNKLHKKNKKRKINFLLKNNIIKNNLNNNSSSLNMINNKKINSKKDYNDSELNSLTYKDAKLYDKRSYFQYYISLIKINELILFSFFPNRDYNSRIIKMFLFFFIFAVHFTVNTLFFNDTMIHKIYIEKGIFNFVYQIPRICYSSLISYIIVKCIKLLALSERLIIQLKNQKILKKLGDIENHKKKLIKILNIKFIFYFLFTFIFLSVFWYYNASFCCIYENTQLHLIKDIFISFGLSLIYPFFKELIPGIFRISALRAYKNKELLFKFSKFIELLL